MVSPTSSPRCSTRIRPTTSSDDIVGRTDGVPLLVEEVVLAHLRAGTVEVHDGATTWRDGDATVPKTIRELIDARLRSLDSKHRRVIVAGAVLGDFEPALIVEVAEADDAVVSDALGSAVRAGLLEVSGGVITFRHAIIREAVLDATVPHVVDTLHRRAAAALDRPSAVGSSMPSASNVAPATCVPSERTTRRPKR